MRIITDHPVAYTSPDHTHPHGTADDSSTNQVFNDKLLSLFEDGLSILDLGCAGGGMVRSFLDQGAFAVGIEGSDYSKVRERAEWGPNGCPGNLFTADIAKPFRISEEPFRISEDRGLDCAELDAILFDVITCWEVLEHIAEDDLPQVFENVANHLKPGGRFIVSISPGPDLHEGVQYHQTIRAFEWWVAKIASLGWRNQTAWAKYFGNDWVRGGMRFGVRADGQAMVQCDAWPSFHLVLERA